MEMNLGFMNKTLDVGGNQAGEQKQSWQTES